MGMVMPASEFRKAAVAGGGTMGVGIVITVLRSGLPAIVYDQSEDALVRSRRQIEEFLQASVKKGKLEPGRAEAAMNNLTCTSKIADLAQADVVVEAIYEDLSVKHALFQALDEVCPADTLFLTNTSTLSITELAAGSGRPDRVVGAHYCLPAQLMKLVEMSRGILTSEESWRRGWEFQLATGQHPIETKDRPGFVLNRFCVPYHNDVIRMIEAGVAEPAEIDRAIKAAMGFAMGPCELLDLIGLDTQIRASEAFLSVTNDPRTAPPPLLRRMAAAGQLGRKTKQGFYNYERDALYGA
jgi:3-hydroxybutyryl-CoA dehydrogenase